MKAPVAIAMAVALTSTGGLAGPVQLSDQDLDHLTAGTASPAGTAPTADGVAQDQLSSAVEEVVFPLLELGGQATVAFLSDPALQEILREDPRAAGTVVDIVLNHLFAKVIPGADGGLLLVPEITKTLIGADQPTEGATVSDPVVDSISYRGGRPIGIVPDDVYTAPRVSFGPTIPDAPGQN